jgi:mRNA interferase RelE/StbE
MIYQVKFTKRASRELMKIPLAVREKITSSLELLRINPFAEIIQFKKLRTNQRLYRIRIGDYRVIYEIHAEVLIIIVIRLGHRKDVYRYLKEI